MSVKALKDAVKRSKKDTFETGDVIAWKSTSARNGREFNYAAIKTPVGWFTTAAGYNSYVSQILTFDELLDVIARAETTEVRIAVEWKSID